MLGLIISSVSMAQFTFNGKVGVNMMHVRVNKTKIPDYNYSNGIGWQLGATAEYQTSSQLGFFLYMGANFRHSVNDKDSSFAAIDTGNIYSYRPNFLCIPYGIGYKFPLKNPDLQFKVYAGLNTQLGIGGKIRKYSVFYIDPLGNPNASTDLQKILKGKKRISYGDKAQSKDFSYDYATANWGIQFGAGIDLTKTAEVELLYCHEFTNGLPGKRRTDEVAKFSFLDLNFKIDLPNKVIAKYKASHK